MLTFKIRFFPLTCGNMFLDILNWHEDNTDVEQELYETKYPNLNCSLLADGVEGLSEVSEAHVNIALHLILTR